MPIDPLCDDTSRNYVLTFATANDGGTFRFHRPVLAFVGLFLTDEQGNQLSAFQQRMTFEGEPFSIAEIGNTTFTTDGMMRVRATYGCPIGYTIDRTIVRLEQAPLGWGFVKQRHFDRRATCDGVQHTLAVRFFGTRKGPIEPGVETSLSVYVSAESPEAPAATRACGPPCSPIHESRSGPVRLHEHSRHAGIVTLAADRWAVCQAGDSDDDAAPVLSWLVPRPSTRRISSATGSGPFSGTSCPLVTRTCGAWGLSTSSDHARSGV
jgi:hypothetical protein